jgi:cytoskeletal protein CcmA (bactofilin family)
MSNLSNKVISSNFQRLLQISESSAVSDGTGSAFALKLSGSSNVGINHDPVAGYSLFVDGAISASTLSVNPGTIFLGNITMSQNNDGGVTFQDSSSSELGAFAGPGYFVLSSSFEEHGASRPLFSMAQEVGGTQNVNVMQVTSTFMKFYTSQTVGSQFSFGAYPSGSDNEGDFFINDNFTVLPDKGGSGNLAQPLLFISKSRNVGLGHFGTIPNRLTTSGSIYAAGPEGHITASGNLLVEGDTTIKGNLTFGDSSTDNVSFGADISSSIIPNADNEYDLGSTTKAFKAVYTNDLYITGSSPNIYANGTERLALGTINKFEGDLSASGILKADTGVSSSNGTFTGTLTAEQISSTDDMSVQDDLTVYGDIKGYGDIRGDNNTNISLVKHISASGDISASGGIIGSTLTGTLQTAAQTNITSVGTLSSLAVAGNITDVNTISLDKIQSDAESSVNVRALAEGFLFSGDLSASGNFITEGHITASGGIKTAGNISGSGTLFVGKDQGPDSFQTAYISASNGNLVIQSPTSPRLLIKESDTEFMRIGPEATSGDMQIGFDDSDDLHIGTLASPGDFSISTKMIIQSSGYVGIGTTAPAHNLDVTGTIGASANISASGDVTGSNLMIDGSDVNFKNLPTSSAGASTGSLYQRTGAQLGLSFTNSGSINFVLIHE